MIDIDFLNQLIHDAEQGVWILSELIARLKILANDMKKADDAANREEWGSQYQR